MREISVTEIAAKYEETIADRLKRHGMYDTIIAMFEAKDMEINRLRNAIYEYAEHVLIMEGTDFISSITDDNLKTLMESICHKDPAK